MIKELRAKLKVASSRQKKLLNGKGGCVGKNNILEYARLEDSKEKLLKEIQIEESKIRINKFRRQLERFKGSENYNIIDEWYDTDDLGYNIYTKIKESGNTTSYDILLIDEAIKTTESCKEEEIIKWNNHKKFLESFKEFLECVTNEGDRKDGC